jgi:hypothetical protein
LALSVTYDRAVVPATSTFVLTSSGGGNVAGTVTYDATNTIATFQPSAALAAGATYTARVTATGANGTAMAAPYSWTFTTATPVGGSPATIWDTAATPASPAADDSDALEIGVKFRSDVAGSITGIRFYKGPGNTGTHIGHLWSSAGALLGTVAFANESQTGWQQANFASPIGIAAGQTYIASYFAPKGHYAVNSGGLASAINRLPLHALASGADGGNGVFAYGSGSFPNQTYGASNYWIDVVFADNAGPVVASRFPATGATQVGLSTIVSATFNEDVQAASIVFQLRDGGGALVAGTSAYNAGTRTITLTPAAPLAPSATYTATVVSATDTTGNAMSGPSSWSFATTGGGVFSLFGQTTPAVPSANDNSAIELGMRFKTTGAGKIQAIRFYKGPANTGEHIGHLWTEAGALLATVTFAGESASGWQEAALSTAVDVAANTIYVVSYYMPNGGYSVNSGFFAGGDITSGPLIGVGDSAASHNGLYRYGAGGGFPTDSYNASNYWVDVQFQPQGA